MVDVIIQNGLAITLVFFLVGAFGSILFQKSPRICNAWSHAFAFLGSAAGVLFSAMVLVLGKTVSYQQETTLPLFEISVRIDPLAAFFIFIVSIVALCTSLYGIGYMAHYHGKYNLGIFGFFYNVFIASMLLIFSAQHAVYFLLLWELMSLASYMLVTFENRTEGTVYAGYIYFVMTHAATACIAFAFLLLYHAAGSFDFDVLRANADELTPSVQTAVFILALIGFGTKAGIIPLHIWLPHAHPAAPAHVSALMSGVMIKTGIFMLIRFFLEFSHPYAPWIGSIILLIGAASSLLGVLYALCEHDLKRLLAYHSIENIGIILLGFGGAMIFASLGLQSFMRLSLVGAFYHTVNHAVFKALLFLGAGSVAHATHTRNIEEYGGLIKTMTWTALCFLIGSMAISGLPPFNGFVSEWLTFQALFSGISSGNVFLTIIFIAGIASLAFTGGLALACFVKAFGVTFLARARSNEAHDAQECSISMRAGMIVLALLTLVFGVFAGSVIPVLSHIVQSVTGFSGHAAALFSTSTTVSVRNQFASISPPIIALAYIGALIVVMLSVYSVTRRRTVTRGLTWDCGTPLTRRMEITATGFSRSLLMICKTFVRPLKNVHIQHIDQSHYFFTFQKIELSFLDIYELYFYRPIAVCAEYVTDRARKIQSGNVNAYILYIVLVFICMIVWLSLSNV
ncbi:hydrogenase 4 subunit B [Candidatus Uhrbacteria bacterium]|nr:hydrogenase 4 subunit B [Candidatus Uhrbacteria bacterium]